MSDSFVNNKESLEERVNLFNQMALPGQPLGMHMGTSYLVNDLMREIQELREALKPFAQAMDWFERRMGNEMQFLDEDSHMIGCEITVAQLRHARAKLEGRDG